MEDLELKDRKHKDKKLIKIGQLVKRQLHPKHAMELALNEEDTELIMEHKRQDCAKERGRK